MTITVPQGDLSRVKSQEPNTDWPHTVELRLGWLGRGGKVVYRTEEITAEEFFGHGSAPISGERIVAAIERMRRQGMPKKQIKK